MLAFKRSSCIRTCFCYSKLVIKVCKIYAGLPVSWGGDAERLAQ